MGRSKLFTAALAGIGLLALAMPALAQWHDHDIHRFHHRDVIIWRGGHWHHVWHGGRLGWWWVVGPSWYFYTAPVYPYPDPYVPQTVVVAPPAGPPPAQSWYYCDDPQGYYPYVNTCRGAWRAVPATPPAPQ